MRLPKFWVYTEGEGGGGAGAGAPGGAAGSGAAGGGTPGGGAPGAGAPGAGGGAAGAGAAGGGDGAPTEFKFKEDRTSWVPPDKLSEMEAKWRRANGDAERYRAMLNAGAGVDVGRTSEPEDPRTVAAREALFKILPPHTAKLLSGLDAAGVEKLNKLLTMDPDKLASALNVIPTLSSSQEAAQFRQASDTLDKLMTGVAKAYGKDKLSKTQEQTVANAFEGYIKSDAKIMQKFVTGDPSLIQDFITAWTNDFVTPFQRQTNAGNVAQSRVNGRLPSRPAAGGPGGGAAAGANGRREAPRTMDSVTDAAWETFATATGRK